MNHWEKIVARLAGARPALPNNHRYAAFKRTEAQIIIAIDYWAHTLGFPGGLNECGRCKRATQWGYCQHCQPVEFARLP